MTALIISTGGARALPLELLLSSIPSLPRHVLDRLVQRAIDHMDELDAATEDMEDDDPAGGAVDDQGEGATLEEWNGQRGLIAYADDEQEEDLDDRCARQPHRQRIQHTRCDRIIDRYGYHLGFKLRPPI